MGVCEILVRVALHEDIYSTYVNIVVYQISYLMNRYWSRTWCYRATQRPSHQVLLQYRFIR